VSDQPEDEGTPPELEAEFDRTERALEDVPEPPELQALLAKAELHNARLNARLLELSVREAHKYTELRNRVASLLFFLTHESKLESMIERGISMVSRTLDDIDPYWRTRGLNAEDYAHYRDLEIEHKYRVMDRVIELEQQDKEQS